MTGCNPVWNHARFSREVDPSSASIPVETPTPPDVRADAVTATPVSDVVAAVLAGDRDAFRSLVEGYYAPVLGLCRRLLYGREADAEEMAQETFFSAYRHLATLVDPARFPAWLYQIARSLCRDRRRRWKVEDRALEERRELLRREAGRRCPSASAVYPGHGGEAAAEGTVGSVLEDLPEDERRALTLRYFEGLTFEEIARSLNLTFSQVDHLIRKARARFARRLAVRQHADA